MTTEASPKSEIEDVTSELVVDDDNGIFEKQEVETLTKQIRLKEHKICEDLLSYLREFLK